MAKLPALIETLAAFQPVHDAAAIRYAARVLREHEAPLLSVGAGGRGAPHMTIRDAVNLLLALNLAQEPGQYAQAALLGSSLARVDDDTALPAETPDVVLEVMTATTLGHALNVLIERAEELCPPRMRLDPFADLYELRRDEGPAVVIELVSQGEDILARVLMVWRGVSGNRRAERRYGVRSGKPSYGRWTTVHFDQALLLALKRTVVAAPPWAFAAEPARR